MSVSKFDAIHSLVGGQLAGDPDGKKINYIDRQKPPSEIEIEDEIARLEVSTKWENVRLERNRRLAETDYLALSDQTLSNNMKNYRDALRDVPSDNSDPDNIDWPAKP